MQIGLILMTKGLNMDDDKDDDDVDDDDDDDDEELGLHMIIF
jgi:hypothetical protein